MVPCRSVEKLHSNQTVALIPIYQWIFRPFFAQKGLISANKVPTSEHSDYTVNPLRASAKSALFNEAQQTATVQGESEISVRVKQSQADRSEELLMLEDLWSLFVALEVVRPRTSGVPASSVVFNVVNGMILEHIQQTQNLRGIYHPVLTKPLSSPQWFNMIASVFIPHQSIERPQNTRNNGTRGKCGKLLLCVGR